MMRSKAEPTWRDELHLARRPLMAFFAVLPLALLLGIASSWIAAQKAEALAATMRVHTQSAARLRNVEVEKGEIQVYQPRFLALQTARLIGGENRLAWIEAVRRAQAGRQLPSVSYDIEPQQLVTMDAPLDLADYQLRASRMQLHMGLVHEMDLFNLLDDLRSAGLFTVEQCKLRRTGQPEDVAGAGPHLLGECSLLWLSLGTKGEG